METCERVTLQLLISSRPALQDHPLDAAVTGMFSQLWSFSVSSSHISSLLGIVLVGEIGDVYLPLADSSLGFQMSWRCLLSSGKSCLWGFLFHLTDFRLIQHW